MNIYDFEANDYLGNLVSLKQYEGKVILVVNTATKCGFTPQYEGLEALYEKYEKDGFVILDFPCNQFLAQAPGTSQDIHSACVLRFGTKFPQFDKIKVNGERISSDAKFCFFTKEEVDPQRIQFGRIKLHYPTSLKYDDLEIDNRKVLQSVSEALHDYAFVVNGFEYDFDDNSLNFICTIVGYNGIPYSRVFINTKGTGSKFSKVSFVDDDSYDLEIVALKKLYGDEANIDSYAEKMEKGRERALDLVAKYLESKGASQITIVSEEFPYSVFDFQYNLNGIAHYCLVKATFTNLDYLDLTAEQYRFVNIFKTASIAFVKNIYSCDQIQIFHSNDLDYFRNNIRRLRLIRGGE